MNEQYLTIKSNLVNLEIRISTTDNAITLYGKTDTQEVNRTFMLDDPDLMTKLVNLWSTFKNEVDAKMSDIFTDIETQVQQFIQEQ